MNVLTVNLLFSTLVFWIAARIYVLPKLHEIPPRTVLLPILLLHSFRHLGLMFLAPGATYPGIPPAFAYPAAFGDLLAALLAVAAIPAVLRETRSARSLVWIFNVEGSVDLLAAIAFATVFDASPSMGPAYWIPAFWVPALLVTHYITFLVLRKHWTGAVVLASEDATVGASDRFDAMMRTHGLTHINLAVRDLERSLKFYTEVFGVKEYYRDDASIQVQGPGSHDVIAFEKDDRAAGSLGGISHFGFRLVDAADIDSAVAAVERAGGELLRRGEFAPGHPFAFVADPDGYEIEVWYE